MPPCGYGYRLLKAIFTGQEDRANEIHVTDLTNYLLRSYLDKTDPVPEMVHHLLYRGRGIAMHQWLDFADDNFQSEVPVEGMGVVGKVDAIFGEDIEDVKTTLRISPGSPQGNHPIQLNMYRYLAGKKGDLRVQYIDMNGPTRCLAKGHYGTVMEMIGGIVQCPKCGHTIKNAHLGAAMVEVVTIPDDEIKELIQERVTELAFAIITDVPPRAEPGWLCGYCSHISCPYNKNGDENGSTSSDTK
jgi:hypothetical protein